MSSFSSVTLIDPYHLFRTPTESGSVQDTQCKRCASLRSRSEKPQRVMVSTVQFSRSSLNSAKLTGKSCHCLGFALFPEASQRQCGTSRYVPFTTHCSEFGCFWMVAETPVGFHLLPGKMLLPRALRVKDSPASTTCIVLPLPSLLNSLTRSRKNLLECNKHKCQR